MNRTLLFLILFCFSSLGFSQKREIPAVLISQNNDTLKLNMVVAVNFFNKKRIEETSISKRVTYRNSEGKKRKIEPEHVKKLIFTDLEGKERVFVYDGNFQLRQVIYEGITKAYYVFFMDPREGVVHTSVIIYDANGERVKEGLFSTTKNALKKAVNEIPELVAIVDSESLTLEEKIILVLSKYDKQYLKK